MILHNKLDVPSSLRNAKNEYNSKCKAKELKDIPTMSDAEFENHSNRLDENLFESALSFILIPTKLDCISNNAVFKSTTTYDRFFLYEDGKINLIILKFWLIKAMNRFYNQIKHCYYNDIPTENSSIILNQFSKVMLSFFAIKNYTTQTNNVVHHEENETYHKLYRSVHFDWNQKAANFKY
jgi:hypothetical protein